MDPVEFLRVVRRRWLYAVIPIVLAIGASLFVSLTATKIYSATASVFFSRPGGASASDLLLGATYTREQLGSYAALATTPVVLDRVIDDLDLDVTASQLDNSVSAVVYADTVIVNVTASGPDPQQSADIANSLARNLGQVAKDLSQSDEGEPAVSASIVAEATVPQAPSSPNTWLNLVAGTLAGVMLGVLAALARDRLDTRVRDSSDLPDSLPVLASIPLDRDSKASPILGDRQSRVRSEAFRRLRINLRFAAVGDARESRVLVVTSASPGDGKSVVALNTGIVLAQAGHSVLVMDADLRLPKVATYTGVVGEVGLADVLVERIGLDDALQDGPYGIKVMTSGTTPPNPSELLGSLQMAQLVDLLRSRFDFVIIDTPALLPVTDGSVAAAQSDGAILVVRHGRTKHGDVARALETLSVVNARVLGVVMNRSPGVLPRESRGYVSYLRENQPTEASADGLTPDPSPAGRGDLGRHKGSASQS